MMLSYSDRMERPIFCMHSLSPANGCEQEGNLASLSLVGCKERDSCNCLEQAEERKLFTAVRIRRTRQTLHPSHLLLISPSLLPSFPRRTPTLLFYRLQTAPPGWWGAFTPSWQTPHCWWTFQMFEACRHRALESCKSSWEQTLWWWYSFAKTWQKSVHQTVILEHFLL